MLHATIDKSKAKSRGATRFPGITKAARDLGVNRVTLYRTLTGEWKLPGLLRRYEHLRKGAA